jgi:iron complex transport system substrate-binding protein
MTRADRVNGAAVICAFVLALGLAALGGRDPAEESNRAGNGPKEVIDAGGRAVAVRPFRRIASTSVVADALLLELSEPDRILALSAYGAKHVPYRYRYEGRALIEDERSAEGILALKPDLFLFQSAGAPAQLPMLRGAGIETFDLGDTRGVASFLTNARTVAALLGHPERGEQFARSFVRRISRVAEDIAADDRRRGLYLVVYGDQLYGGAAGTSYHDVIERAGLIDAAAGYRNWPQYSPEQVLTLNPEVIVTKTGMKEVLCRMAGLARLSACGKGMLVEMDPDVIDDAGLLMLDAAEQIHDRVYGGRMAAEAPGAHTGVPGTPP